MIWWLLRSAAVVVYHSILDLVLFVIVDSFAKFVIGDASARSDVEKKLIWKWESFVLLALTVLVYVCDHTPVLLFLLSVITFIYTQFEGGVNLYQWWVLLRTRWEEHQQHQDSMTRMQEQLSEQRKQQEWLMNARNLSKGHGVLPQAQQNMPVQPSLPLQNQKPMLRQRSSGFSNENQANVVQNHSMLSGMPRMKLGNIFRKLYNNSSHEKKTSQEILPQPSLNMQKEFSFLPKQTQNQNLVGHLGTDMEDSPPRKSAWYGDNLARRPLHSRVPYSPIPSPDTMSLKSKVMSAFGMRGDSTMPPGIRNEGQNLCFMNSILQCVARTPHLVQELARDASSDSDCSVAESLLISTLVEILQSCNMESGNKKPVLDPLAFRQAAATLRPGLVSLPTQHQSQQDAAEFFMWLMDSVHNVLNKNRKTHEIDMKDEKRYARLRTLKFIYGDLHPAKIQDLKNACHQEINAAHGLMNDSYAEPVQRLSDLEWLSYKKQNDSVIDNTFSGQLVIAYHCLTDNHISVNMQTFSILPVPIVSPRDVNGLVMLSDCFTKYCNVEHLVGQEGLECTYCNVERAKQQNHLNARVMSQHQGTTSSPLVSKTPRMNTRQNQLSSADSAVSGMNSPLPMNFMSPIPGTRDAINDSGFQDNVFKTSTPISDHTMPRLRDAERRCLLRTLPDCLVIQLMRFSYNPFTRLLGKVTSPISIPLNNLDLTDIMFDTITNREQLSEEDVCYKYDLYGVCCHMGADSTNFGHYVSYCLQSDGKWYRFDDEVVSQVNMQFELTTQEIRENAYILFYKKINL